MRYYGVKKNLFLKGHQTKNVYQISIWGALGLKHEMLKKISDCPFKSYDASTLPLREVNSASLEKN
jgi:hypothetical protein